MTGVMVLAGTPVATPGGWRQVEHLRAGDAVLTDRGARRLRAVLRFDVAIAAQILPHLHWPIRVPTRVVGNLDALAVLPDVSLCLIDDRLIVPAAALIGWRGVEVERQHSRLPRYRLDLPDACFLRIARGAQVGAAASGLPLEQARRRIACLMAEDAGAALRVAGSPGNQAAFF